MNAINKSDQPTKVVINELYAQDIIRMSKFHMLYLTYMMAKENITKTTFKDPNVKSLLELIMRVFALNELMQDSTALYETGYFRKGSSDLLN